MRHRTNVVLDMDHVEAARRALGTDTITSTIDAALRMAATDRRTAREDRLARSFAVAATLDLRDSMDDDTMHGLTDLA